MTNPSLEQQQVLECQAIFEHSGIAVVCTRARRVYHCNLRAAELFGWPEDTLLGQADSVFHSGAETRRLLGGAFRQTLLAGQSAELEVPLARRDGTTFTAHLIARVVDPAAPRQGVVWIVRDITREVLARERNKQLLLEQQLIFENVRAGIVILRDRVIQRCNRRLGEIFGYTPEEMIGKPMRLFYPSDDEWLEVGRRTYAAIAEHGIFRGDAAYRRRDGSVIWCNVTGSMANPADEKDGYVFLYDDVTAQRTAEESLRRSHQQLEQRVAERTLALSEQLRFMRQLVEAIPGPVFYKDVRGCYLGCNQAYLDLIGKARGEVIGATAHDFLPVDMAEQEHALDQDLFGRSGSPVQESKIRCADGSERDFVIHRATYGPYGREDGLVGVMLDITGRKRMEARLQQAATVFDSSVEGIIITAPDGRTLMVNRAFSEITGYSEEEVIGRNPRFLKSGRTDESVYREMWQTLAECGRWRGELWNRCKNGRNFLESLTISGIKDCDGLITHYVGVFSDVTELRLAHEQLRHQANHDSLTGLPNRLLLVDRLHKALQYANREKKNIAVLFIDLDHFKEINDTLGHKAGDQVLCEVSTRMKRLLRESDTVGRLGGDEFLIIASDIAEPATAGLIADKILKALRGTPVIADPESFVGASIGISVFPQDGDSGEILMTHADTAMYRAKSGGRDTYEFFAEDLTRSSMVRSQMATDLLLAMEREELRVHLQAQYCLETGAVIGAEALLLWQHPAQGLLMPGQFIGIAERSGLTGRLGEWLLRQAGDQWLAWLNTGYTPGIVTINLSGMVFARGAIRDILGGMLETAGLPVALLNIEVSESAIMSDAANRVEVLGELRAMGFGVIIRDSGSGSSSLARLSRLPLDRIKLDPDLVRGSTEESGNSAVVHAIVALAHSLRLPVLADGIDNREQRDFAIRAGCDQIQGNFCAPALPFEAYEQRFLRT